MAGKQQRSISNGRAVLRGRKQSLDKEDAPPTTPTDYSGAVTRRRSSRAADGGVLEVPPAPRPAGMQRKSGRSPKKAPELTGLWSHLPEEVMELILQKCTPQQLGMLETTCSFFYKTGIAERVALTQLKAIPRAKGLRPNKKAKERWTSILHFVNCQTNAAAQATAVSFGSYHTSALLIQQEDSSPSTSGRAPEKHHSLYTFGRGFHGQLGIGSYDNHSTPELVSLGYRACLDNPDYEEMIMPAVVTCGSSHTATISRKGELFTWGLASSGELGHGGWTPIEVALPKQCLLPNPCIRVVSICCGANHTLAIAENGGLWSCGRGRHGQLGHGAFNDEGCFKQIAGLAPHRMVSAAAGIAHSMALASDGSLFTWGDGRYGQIGQPMPEDIANMIPDPPVLLMCSPLPKRLVKLEPGSLKASDRITAIAAGGNHSVALTVGGSLVVFGRNKHGALGTGDNQNIWSPTKIRMALPGESEADLRAVQVVCGDSHTMALVMNRGCMEIRTTGLNSWGQLGHGDRKERLAFTPLPRTIRGVVSLQAGDDHSAAITHDGGLYLWGRGDCGQLGVGEERSRWKPTKLQGFAVVNPDKTLRRHKRSQRVLRQVTEPAEKSRPKMMCHHQ